MLNFFYPAHEFTRLKQSVRSCLRSTRVLKAALVGLISNFNYKTLNRAGKGRVVNLNFSPKFELVGQVYNFSNFTYSLVSC